MILYFQKSRPMPNTVFKQTNSGKSLILVLGEGKLADLSELEASSVYTVSSGKPQL